MSIACVQNYLRENVIPQLLDELKNGEVRFLALTEGSNEQGFISSVYSNRTVEFFPCTWVTTKIDEKIVATQIRALIGYKITIPVKHQGETINFSQKDRIHLRTSIEDESDPVELEIHARINQANTSWTIYATELE